MTMTTTITNTLRVPGAQLHYEVRGSGPLLLLICGGVYDADGYAGLAHHLTDRYTVLTYDRRGNSRSPLDGPPAPQSIQAHGDDAHRLLSAVAADRGETAAVFGNSSGAIIAMELAARHPEQVHPAVAHEPPLFELLPDRDHWRTVISDVERAYRSQGPGPAGQILGAALQMGGGAEEDGRVPGGAEAPAEPDPETAAVQARMGRNMEFFLGYEVPGFARYTPDVAALRLGAARIVMAAGADSVGEPPYRCATATAALLGSEPVIFPGDHGGFGNRSAEFASILTEVFSG
jgi:pimeloyl-ACP methyl ester carboxylesterase